MHGQLKAKVEELQITDDQHDDFNGGQENRDRSTQEIEEPEEDRAEALAKSGLSD